MGTSSKKVYPRSNKLVNDNISNGNIQSNGSGISSIIPDLLFPKNGQSKVIKNINETINSTAFTKSIKKIFDISKTVSAGGFGAIGIPDFKEKPLFDQIELLADAVGIADDDYLKQSFIDLVQEATLPLEELLQDPIGLIIGLIKKIMKFQIEGFSFEDSSALIENFDDKNADKEIDAYLQSVVGGAYDDELRAKLLTELNNDGNYLDIVNLGKIRSLRRIKEREA